MSHPRRTMLAVLTLLALPWLLPAPGCGKGGDDPVPADPTPAAAEDPTAAAAADPSGAATPAAPKGLSTQMKTALKGISAEDRDRTVPEGTDAAAGKMAYDAQCAACHGATGKGDGAAAGFLDPKPGDLSSPDRAGKTTAGEKAALIANGVGSGSAMPGFSKSLGEEQIWQLVAYLETLQD